MYEILIVDDEPRIREGLSHMIRKLQGDWVVAGEAANGLQALEFLKNRCVDLVITDVRMPVMDGIEFVEHLQKEYPDIRKVLLSGYDEFDYVQKAIKNGASNYLLKPLKSTDLKQALAQELSSLQLRDKNRQEALEISKENKFLKINNLLNELLDGNEINEETVRAELIHLDVQPGGPPFAAAAARLDFPMTLSNQHTSGAVTGSMLNLVQKLAEVVFHPGEYLLFPRWRAKNEFVFILWSRDKWWDEASSDIFRLSALEAIRRIEKEYPDLVIRIGIGNQYDKLNMVFLSYREALTALGKLEPECSSEVCFSNEASRLVEKAKNYILNNLEKHITLSMIAEHVYLNMNYFSGLFRAQTGENFIDYLTRLRVQKGVELIQSTNLKIYEIAERVGYTSPKQFTRVFKGLTGVTPEQFKEEQSKKVKNCP